MFLGTGDAVEELGQDGGVDGWGFVSQGRAEGCWKHSDATVRNLLLGDVFPRHTRIICY